MDLDLEKRLKGTQKGFIVQELFMNSIHFPLAIIFLELLIESPLSYLKEPDLYTIIVACLVQAYFMGTWRYRETPHRFLGNLIAPSIYTLVEGMIEGIAFFSSPHHVAYWVFSIVIGLLQETGFNKTGILLDILTVLEHVVRTSILLVMYWLFEAMTEPDYSSIGSFLSNDSHVFVTIVIPLLGVVIGFMNVSVNHYLKLLQKTAGELRKYSEWLLGKELLSAAISDSGALSLQRKERTVIFMDIRGFTAWSENKSPEIVVRMLNEYFEKAEQIWKKSRVIKTKHTADEIMAVFPSEQSALKSAVQLNHDISFFLEEYGLSAGIGIHCGYLVEGLIGSEDVKMYDVIGDTVNTAKRICDQAKGGEILISEQVHARLNDAIPTQEPRLIQAKGKVEPLKVFPVMA